MNNTRRTFLRYLCTAAIAVKAVPLLEKASILLPVSDRDFVAEHLAVTFYDKKSLDILKKNLSGFVYSGDIPKCSGKTIQWFRYEYPRHRQ